MRVLWFTNTPSLYKCKGTGYNGGGWITSLQKEIAISTDIALGISFLLENEPTKAIEDKVCYYPISSPWTSTFSKIKHQIDLIKKFSIKECIPLINKMLWVIDDFKPDIIEVFGSEQYWGLIAKYTNKPVILHIQGILNPYNNAFLPPGVSLCNYIWSPKSIGGIVNKYKSYRFWKNSCEREIKIIKGVKHFIGRTEWDERVTKVMNPICKYYYGSEILRDTFYKPSKRELPQNLTIVSTISSPLFKGFDLILKTAKLLKDTYKVEFAWKVFGNVSSQYIEKKIKINNDDVNIQLLGVQDAETIKEEILHATCYFHSSYIDNSPNSICEAQILGCPVISTNVGGISSLIENEQNGYLIPANDPYQATFLIKQLYEDTKLNIEIGENARKTALLRHDKHNIVMELISIYKRLLEENCI